MIDPNNITISPLPKIQYGYASYSGLSPAICTGESAPGKYPPIVSHGRLRAVHERILAATGRMKNALKTVTLAGHQAGHRHGVFVAVFPQTSRTVIRNVFARNTN